MIAVEIAEPVDDLLDDQARQPRDPRQDPVSPRRDRQVDRAGLPVVAEQLGEATEVEQLLVRQCGELGERALDLLLRVDDDVVANQGGPVARSRRPRVSSSCISIRRPSVPSSMMYRSTSAAILVTNSARWITERTS